MKFENIHNKREIEQSEARDKVAKVLSGMVPLGSSVRRAVKSLGSTSLPDARRTSTTACHLD